VRVSHADYSLIPIPNSQALNSTLEMDYLFVGDSFATRWTALNFTRFKSDDTVAIFGAGPIGLLATHSDLIRGASKVYIINYVPERLALTSLIGVVPIDFTALVLQPIYILYNILYFSLNLSNINRTNIF
jgi:threonine dehydrogenase-like Zn-dependent dehydrogenase